MAVVQISRIQIRRGQANQGTGFPQLASGELGWAIDTQQLYIGNGAVSEGSPSVGNTRILTQTDLSGTSNLLQQLQHIYRVNDVSVITGPNVNTPVQRSLQTRLDDFVNTADFGTRGDGIGTSTANDDTNALQRAINQLFLNDTTKAYSNTVAGTAKRVVLQMPAGQYNISSTIYIPSYASLIGAGADKTVIYYNPVSTITGATALNSYVITTSAAATKMIGATVSGTGIPTGSTVSTVIVGTSITISAPATATGATVNITVTLAGAAIQFVNDSSTASVPSSIGSTLGTTQPRNIIIKDLTIWTPTGKNSCLQLDAVKDSIFENLNLRGDWNSSLNSLSRGIYMQAVSSIVTCERNIFKNIKFEKFSYAVSTLSDIRYNSFIDCFVTDAYQGFALGVGANASSSGQQYGPRETEIVNCKFYNVRRQAIYVDLGTANTTRDCKYINVGNDGAGNTGAIYPQVYFANYGNTSQNDFSDRPNDLAASNLSVQYVPEVSGHGTYYLAGTRAVVLGFISSTPTLAFRLPCSTTVMGIPNSSVTYSISYIYKSSANSFTRRGVITLSADIDSKQIQLSDDYDFAGVDANGTNALLLDFKGYFLDATGAVYTGAGGQSVISIGVYYTNNLNGDTGTMAYSYTANL